MLQPGTVMAVEFLGALGQIFPSMKGEKAMPRELGFSSYECDCGHQSHFFENTIREMRAKSKNRKVFLGDSEPEEHTVVFESGKMVAVLCPKEKRREESK